MALVLKTKRESSIRFVSYILLRQLPPWREPRGWYCSRLYRRFTVAADDGLVLTLPLEGQVLFSHPGANYLDNTFTWPGNHTLLPLTIESFPMVHARLTAGCPHHQGAWWCFGIESAMITTIHSSMNDQQVIDDTTATFVELEQQANQSFPVDTKLHKGIERISRNFLTNLKRYLCVCQR